MTIRRRDLERAKARRLDNVRNRCGTTTPMSLLWLPHLPSSRSRSAVEPWNTVRAFLVLVTYRSSSSCTLIRSRVCDFAGERRGKGKEAPKAPVTKKKSKHRLRLEVTCVSCLQDPSCLSHTQQVQSSGKSVRWTDLGGDVLGFHWIVGTGVEWTGGSFSSAQESSPLGLERPERNQRHIVFDRPHRT